MVYSAIANGSYGLVESEMFGANILAHRDTLDEETNFAGAISELGVTSLRYPGGSLTEYYFDIGDPNRSLVIDETGNFDATQAEHTFIPLKDFLQFASDEDLSVSIVLPTRTNLTDATDANGNRWEAVDEAELRSFVHSLVDGSYGDAQVTALEIGNEYWLSGEMTSVEYGRVASKMADIVQSELDMMSEAFPSAADIEIVLQTGHNYGDARLSEQYEGWSSDDILIDLNAKYGLDLHEDSLFSNGAVNWTHIANELIQSEFDEAEFAAIDGISVHLYSNNETSEGAVNFHLSMIEADWLSENGQLEVHATEWNETTASDVLESSDDRGLWSAQEILETFKQMNAAGVTEANVWPVLQNTPNALAHGFEFSELSPSGEIFSMMSETLVGKAGIDLVDSEGQLPGDLYLFYGDQETVAYFAADETVSGTVTIDLSPLFEDLGDVQGSLLGVEEGEDPGSASSSAKVSDLNPSEITSGSSLVLDLKPGEIVQISFMDFAATDDFEQIIEAIDEMDLSNPVDLELGGGDGVDDILHSDEPVSLDELIPAVAPDEPDDEDDQEDNSDDDGGGGGFAGGILGLLPLLLLGGLGL